MGEVIVDGVKFVFDESGTKLVKKSLAEAQGAASTPLHTSINGEAYIRTKNGNLISQSLVRERRARAKGKQLGRPVKDPGAAHRVAALRAEGMSLRVIAAAEGISASGVRKMLLRAAPAVQPVED